MLIKLKYDVYNISQRIKDIDSGYYLVYNTSKLKFEVHNVNQKGGTYCLTLPYKQLDERTLQYVYETKSENIEKIMERIENENKIRESAEKSSTFSNIYSSIEDLRR